MDAIVRAIDVGYGNTKYVTQAEGGSIRCAHFASVAPATAGQPGAALGDKRRTLGIAIGDLTYEVGPDAHLAAEVYQMRQMHDGYCETPEYLALTRGALGFMKLERIDLLVLGLPVATYKTRRASLERRMKAVHPLDKGRSVSVERVKVVAQPQGALMLFGVQSNRIDQINHERNLVIDAGARIEECDAKTQALLAPLGHQDRGMRSVRENSPAALEHSAAQRQLTYRSA
jgi:plasmid segregation protein ParM